VKDRESNEREREKSGQVHQGISLQLVKRERERERVGWEEEDRGREGKDIGGLGNWETVFFCINKPLGKIIKGQQTDFALLQRSTFIEKEI